MDSFAAIAASHISRRSEDGVTQDDLIQYFSWSLGANSLTENLLPALAWLSDPTRVLAYRDELQRHHLTVLGLKATRSMLPLSLAAGFAQLHRDFLTVDPSDRLLSDWQPMDHLIALNLLHDRMPSLRQFSAALVEQVDSWFERQVGNTSLLYAHWLRGDKGFSKAEEVFGSLA